MLLLMLHSSMDQPIFTLIQVIKTFLILLLSTVQRPLLKINRFIGIRVFIKLLPTKMEQIHTQEFLTLILAHTTAGIIVYCQEQKLSRLTFG